MASPVEPSKDPSRCPPPAVLIEETALENPTPKPSQPTERCEIVINLCFRSLRLGVVCSTAVDNPEPPRYNKVSVIEEIRTQGLCLPIERYFDFFSFPFITEPASAGVGIGTQHLNSFPGSHWHFQVGSKREQQGTCPSPYLEPFSVGAQPRRQQRVSDTAKFPRPLAIPRPQGSPLPGSREISTPSSSSLFFEDLESSLGRRKVNINIYDSGKIP